jgi:inosine-uridine nucleoside N-ribohydrolase
MINDSAGDPDGLTAVAHAVLSKTTQLVGLVGTDDGGSGRAKANHDKILELAGVTVPSYAGGATKLTNTTTPVESDGARALVKAATDFVPPGPSGGNFSFYQKLFVTVGGSLTEVASAILMDPSITAKITLVWIGGRDNYDGTPDSREWNLGLDINAANVVFGSNVEIWQVPSNAYTQCLISMTEMRRDLYPYGELGKWLFEAFVSGSQNPNNNQGEAWVLGDNPLVLLTAVTPAFFGAEPISSRYHMEEARLIKPDGSYDLATPNPNPNARQIRVYNVLDTRVMFADFFAKMQGKFPLNG